MKKCAKCKQTKTKNEFYPNKKWNDGFYPYCKICKNIVSARYYKENKEKIRLQSHGYYLNNKNKFQLRNREWAKRNKDRKKEIHNKSYYKIKKEVIEKYGGKCVCCGENKSEFMTFDHKYDDGKEWRKKVKTNSIYWIKKNNFPKDFQLLCYNCNYSKGNAGYCPHWYEK